MNYNQAKNSIAPIFFIVTLLSNAWINIATFIIRLILLSLTSVYTQIFRNYLSSGPVTSKTAIHSLARSLTYVYQLIQEKFIAIIKSILCATKSRE